jgi:xanthine dehydrogenase iron-sulfur cluster and FAD-binding subunit A
MSRSVDGAVESLGVNSCLVKLPSVDGYAVTTTEGLGNSRDGYHPLQKRIVGFNGSQCGFCTPGWV